VDLKEVTGMFANAPAAAERGKIPNYSMLFYRASTLRDCLETGFCLRKPFTQPC
jgi:hypothetical protein